MEWFGQENNDNAGFIAHRMNLISMNQNDITNNWRNKWGRRTALLYRKILINNTKENIK